MLTPTTKQRLRELAGKATPGEWVRGFVHGRCHKPSHKPGQHPGALAKDPCVYDYSIDEGDDHTDVCVRPNITLICGSDERGNLTYANAAYIAAASPDVVTQLLDENARLRALCVEACELAKARFGAADCWSESEREDFERVVAIAKEAGTQ